MSSPSSKDVHDAIMTNSRSLVVSYLEQGIDVKANLARALPRLDDVYTHDEETEEKTMDKTCFVARRNSGSFIVTAVHLAVINCYHQADNGTQAVQKAEKILQAVLNRGSDVTCGTQGIVLCNFGNWNHHSIEEGTTPLNLAIYLKQNLQYLKGSEQTSMMDTVIEVLMKASKQAGHLKPPTCAVPKSVVTTWKKLLFSQDFSDVKFVMPDQTELFAHKCVLSAASDYFHAYFLGPWSANHPDGVWKTSNSPENMKAVLSFIYTGNLSPSTVDSQASDLLAISQEYNLPELARLAEASCIRKLGSDNIKDMLLLAHLHESDELEKACFRHVRCNAATILTRPDFIALSVEEPDLWSKLSQAISPNDA